MSRKKLTPFAPWESDKPNGVEKRYIRMGNSLMLHPSTLKLSNCAFRVLTHMKLESGGAPEFKFPYSKYKAIVSKGGFQSAIKELSENGFIVTTQKNANLRCPNIYKFSEEWKKRDS